MLKSINMIKNSNNQIIEISKSIQQWMKTNDNSLNLRIQPLLFSEVEKHISESFTPILEAKTIFLEIVKRKLFVLITFDKTGPIL